MEYTPVWTDRKGNQHFSFDLAESFYPQFYLTDKDKVAVDLTGITSTLYIRKSRFEDILIQKTCVNLNQTTYKGKSVCIVTTTDINDNLSIGVYEYEIKFNVASLQAKVKRGTIIVR